MELRAYQKEAVRAVINYYRERPKKAPLVVMPTGSGKSHVIAEIAKMVLRQDRKAIIISHRKEILAQNAEKLRAVIDDKNAIGIYSAGLGSKDFRQITFGGIQSLHNSKEIPPFNLVIIDECHLVPKKGRGMYLTFLKRIREINPDVKLLGFTATPERLDSGPLITGIDKIFDGIAYTAEVRRLTDEGHLSPLINKNALNQGKLRGVGVRGGDFIKKEASKRMMADSLTDRAINEIEKYAKDRKKILIFCVDIEHTYTVCMALRSRGVLANFITGKTPSIERSVILKSFKRGRTEALVNCEVLTTGFDAPNVDCVVILRPTKSRALFIQMVGRGSRIADNKKDCLVLDFAGNFDRHGPIDSEPVKAMPWKGKTKKLHKTCKECRTVLPIRVKECGECGYIFENVRGIIKHESFSAIAPIYKDEAIEVPIDGIMGVEHKKKGKPNSLRLVIKSGLKSYNDYLCIEHGGYATAKAKKTWQRLAGTPAPTTTKEALERIKEIKKPKSAKVTRNGKWWNVESYD